MSSEKVPFLRHFVILLTRQKSPSKSASLLTASTEKPASELVKDWSNLISSYSVTLQQAWNEDAVKSLYPVTGPAAPPLPSPFLFGGSEEENISFECYLVTFLKDPQNTYTEPKAIIHTLQCNESLTNTLGIPCWSMTFICIVHNQNGEKLLLLRLFTHSIPLFINYCFQDNLINKCPQQLQLSKSWNGMKKQYEEHHIRWSSDTHPQNPV